MDAVRCELIRWVSDEPQPGVVEVRLVDASGEEWAFIDKIAIFTADNVSSTTTLPVPAAIRCELLATRQDDLGREVVDVQLKDRVETADGVSRLTVQRADLVGPAHA